MSILPDQNDTLCSWKQRVTIVNMCTKTNQLLRALHRATVDIYASKYDVMQTSKKKQTNSVFLFPTLHQFVPYHFRSILFLF